MVSLHERSSTTNWIFILTALIVGCSGGTSGDQTQSYSISTIALSTQSEVGPEGATLSLDSRIQLEVPKEAIKKATVTLAVVNSPLMDSLERQVKDFTFLPDAPKIQITTSAVPTKYLVFKVSVPNLAELIAKPEQLAVALLNEYESTEEEAAEAITSLIFISGTLCERGASVCIELFPAWFSGGIKKEDQFIQLGIGVKSTKNEGVISRWLNHWLKPREAFAQASERRHLWTFVDDLGPTSNCFGICTGRVTLDIAGNATVGGSLFLEKNFTLYEPLPGKPHVTSDFGPRDCKGCSPFHFGVDLRAQTPTPVHNILPGQVTLASGISGPCGIIQAIFMEHLSDSSLRGPGDMGSKYLHLSTFLASRDDIFFPRVQIATSGDTGTCIVNKKTQPHLHLETQFTFNNGDATIDPLPLLMDDMSLYSIAIKNVDGFPNENISLAFALFNDRTMQIGLLGEPGYFDYRQFSKYAQGEFRLLNMNDPNLDNLGLEMNSLGDGHHFIVLRICSARLGGCHPAYRWEIYVRPTLILIPSPCTLHENGPPIEVAVLRRGSPPQGPVGFTYSSTDGTARQGLDYILPTGTLTFSYPSPEPHLKFTIFNMSDSSAEPDETFTVHISNPTGGAVILPPGNFVQTVRDAALPGSCS